MPYHVAKSSECQASKPWGVIKDTDGSVQGCHATQGGAETQMAALYAAEADAGMRSTARRRSAPRTVGGRPE